MSKSKVCAVIVNYNGKDLTDKLISSLSKNSYRDFSVIVVDNASEDGSQTFLKEKHPSVTLVENKENKGYSGINAALPHCRGEYLLFLNNDMVADPDCISKLAEYLDQNSEAGMAVPRLINSYDPAQVSGGTWLSRTFYSGHKPGKEGADNIETPYLGVGMIRVSIVKRYGYLFDPDYFIYGEDVDLGLRIRNIGKRVVMVGGAVLYHAHAVTTMKHLPSAKTTYLMERNLLATFIKDLPLSRILLYLPYLLLFRVAVLARDLVLLRFRLALARIKAFFAVIFWLPALLRKRRHIRKLGKASTRFLVSVFTERHLLKKKFLV